MISSQRRARNIYRHSAPALLIFDRRKSWDPKSTILCLRSPPLLTVLSSGPHLFSSSERLTLLHHQDSPDYNLQISRVRFSDAGVYICQLNTQAEIIVINNNTFVYQVSVISKN